MWGGEWQTKMLMTKICFLKSFEGKIMIWVRTWLGWVRDSTGSSSARSFIEHDAARMGSTRSQWVSCSFLLPFSLTLSLPHSFPCSLPFSQLSWLHSRYSKASVLPARKRKSRIKVRVQIRLKITVDRLLNLGVHARTRGQASQANWLFTGQHRQCIRDHECVVEWRGHVDQSLFE